MHLAYLDEQDDERGQHSSFTACVFDADRMQDYKASLFSGLRRVFRRPDDDARPFPLLHASALPNELDDEQKIELCLLVCNCIAEYCTFVYRVGYSWKHPLVVGNGILPERVSDQVNARLLSLTNLQHEVWQYVPGPLVFIHELDFANLARFETYYNYSQHSETSWQLELLTGDTATSIPNKVLGSLYCNKKDHFMYAADFSGYQLGLKEKKNPTDFQSRCMFADRFEHLVVRNDIVGPY